MEKIEAVKFFGSQAKLARAARVSRAAVAQWGERVPMATAAVLDKVTHGKLRFNPDEYRRKPGA